MNQEMKHTRGPYIVFNHKGEYGLEWYSVGGEGDLPFCKCAFNDTHNKENAEFIARACNSHYHLIAALERLLLADGVNWDDVPSNIIDEIRTTIKKAKGKS